VRANIRAMTWLEDATLLAIAARTLATYALVWMTAAPGLGFLPILVGSSAICGGGEAGWAGVPPATSGSPQVAIPKAAGATSTDQPGTQARDRQPRP
jgi:hypothetical protein